MTTGLSALALGFVLVLGLAACGGDGTQDAIDVDTLTALAAESEEAGGLHDEDDHHHSHAGSPDTANTAYDGRDLSMINASSGEIPDVDMIDVSSGATVNLQSLAAGDEPLLFWFWAPH